MSGIAGILYKDSRSVDPRDLQRMLAALFHRGPDASGVWHHGPIGLGHCMLRTTPESLDERQPIANETGDVVLTADARLDNRSELISTLEIEEGGARISDGELILGAYEKWGERCPERLLGDFAFALWDGRKGKLFCARDHLGIRPFYYHETEVCFVFASEIKGLLSLSRPVQKLNLVRVCDYLAGFFEDTVSTFYKDILRLPPAHCVGVGQKGSDRRCYWALDPSREIRRETAEEYEEEFRHIFFEAVKCRMRCSLPAGCLLSGGLDSSSVVATVRALSRGTSQEPLATFSATFPSFPRTDEKEYVGELLKDGGICSEYVSIDPISPFKDIDRAFQCQDEPFQTPNWFVFWTLADTARKRGIRVLLDGIDGDTTVSHGFDFLSELFFSGRWTTLATEIYWLSRRLHHSPLRFLWHYGFSPLATELGWWGLRKFLPARALRIATPEVLNPGLARRVGCAERYESMLGDRFRPVRSERKEHLRALSSGMVPFYMEVLDRFSAAFGIDHRHPYFDRRLVEFCLALPPTQKLHHGWDRAIQRNAMARVLPERIARRISKSVWRSMFERGLFDLGRDTLEKIINEDPGPLAEFVDLPVCRNIYRRCLASRPDDVDVMTLWVVTTFALWLCQSGLSP